MKSPQTVYISGPMTGLPGHNFPAFADAETLLGGLGYTVLSPHRNFGGRVDLPRDFYMRQDISNVSDSDLVVVLDGWENSAGARLEVLIARELNLPVYNLLMEPVLEPVVTNTATQLRDGARELFAYAATGRPVPAGPPPQNYVRTLDGAAIPCGIPPLPPAIFGEETTPTETPVSILEEAQGLIHGDRQGSYGHPWDDFTRTGRLWGAILDMPPIEPERVGLMMVALKGSRSCNDLNLGRPIKRDNLVDMAGYAGTVEMVQEYRR